MVSFGKSSDIYKQNHPGWSWFYYVAQPRVPVAAFTQNVISPACDLKKIASDSLSNKFIDFYLRPIVITKLFSKVYFQFHKFRPNSSVCSYCGKFVCLPAILTELLLERAASVLSELNPAFILLYFTKASLPVGLPRKQQYL